MLWYKAWRETRGRLLISASVLLWASLVIVLMQKGMRAHADEPMTYASYIWAAIYKGTLRDVFIVLVIGLGVDGLLQERARGTAGFTLALPVGRFRLVAVRAGIGLAEMVFLAMLPVLVLSIGSPIVGESYALSQALEFSLLWIVCGMVIFGTAFLLAAILPGEYSSWLVSFVLLVAYSIGINVSPLRSHRALDLFQVMNGSMLPDFRQADGMLIGPLPLLPLAVIALLSLGLLALANQITQRRDFA
jgi:ABC-2 type transport system permease protein